MRRGLAEFLGTFTLVFAGTGAIVVNQVQSGVVTHPGIAAVFGLVVAAMIYTFGDVSGAHLNPAVTLAFTASGRFPARQVPLYLAAQILGAIAGSALLSHLFPGTKTLGETLPAGSARQSFIFEVVLTLILMLVILQVSIGAREKGITAGLAIGATVGLEALFAGPICGASMNPARSLGPALVSGRLSEIWIYLIAPTLGALLAIPLHRILHPSPPPNTP